MLVVSEMYDDDMAHSLDAALGDRAVFESGALNMLLEAMREAVVITTIGLEEPGPIITFVNSAFELMTGHARREVIGRTPRMFQGPDTSRAELDRMRRALTAGRTFEGEAVNYRKSGEAFLLRWAVVPIFNDFGQAVAWLSLQSEAGAPADTSLEDRASALEERMREHHAG